MKTPHTLRDVAGLPTQLPALADCTLILIDCQNTYRQGLMTLDGIEPALAEAASVLAKAREAGSPVIHVQHDSGPGSVFDIRAEIGAIADPVAPADGEAVVIKHLPNAFAGTDLADRIAASGRTEIVLVGFMTHMCINSTARGAFTAGLKPVVVASATATRPLPTADGGVVSASALQVASLAALGDLFARIAPDSAALAG